VREDHAEHAARNVATFFGERPANWDLVTADVAEYAGPEVDRVVLDMLGHGRCSTPSPKPLSPAGC